MSAAERVDVRGAVPQPARRPSHAAPVPGARGRAADAPHPVELAGLLHELTALLLDAGGMADALTRLAGHTLHALPDVVRCSATLVGEGAPQTLSAAGDDLAVLDEAQYTLGQGPAVDATRTRALITAPDLGADPRWPDLAARVPGGGVSAVAVPLDVRRRAVGSLCVLLDRRGGLEPASLIVAMAFAGQAEVLLGEVLRRHVADQLTADQIAELRTDAVVDHAAGVIVAQRGCDPTEAYAVLRETAERLNVSAAEVATRLVETAIRRSVV
jgi:hypothetical protein